jgi:hypothetical protein
MGVDELSRAIAEYVAIKRMLSTREIQEHIRFCSSLVVFSHSAKAWSSRYMDVTSLCRLAEQVVALANLFLCHFTLPSSTRLGC